MHGRLPKLINNRTRPFLGSKGLLLIKNNRVAVIKRDKYTNYYPGFYDLPGGIREGSETPVETFIREVREETSISVKKSDIIYAKEQIEKEGDHKIRNWFFMVAQMPDITIKNLRLGDEGQSITTLPLKDLLNNPLFIPSYKEPINQYLQNQNSTP